MVLLEISLFFFAILHTQQETYYVDIKGVDDTTCGSQSSPCATINQVVTNNPGASYVVSIGDGSFATSSIILLDSSAVTFQGAVNTTIAASWDTELFLVNSDKTSFVFRDVTLGLSSSKGGFSALVSEANTASFFNVVLIYDNFYSFDFIDLQAGSLVLSNVTFSAQFESYFIGDVTYNELVTSINISDSTFSNISITEEGGLVVFESTGPASVLINNTVFTNISTEYLFIFLWAEDLLQEFKIYNNLFLGFQTDIPGVYIQTNNGSLVYIGNNTWQNCLSEFVTGAVELLGWDEADKHQDVQLSNLTFINCTGPYSGGLLVAYSPLNLTDSTFANNSGEHGNDFAQVLDDATASFRCDIANSYSSSPRPKAVIWNIGQNTIQDISDRLPDPTNKHRISLAPRPLLKHIRAGASFRAKKQKREK